MQRGLTLYLSIIIMAILLALVLGLTAISVTQLKMTRGIENSVVAFYAADAGVERVLAIIYDAIKYDTESSLSLSYPSTSGEFDDLNTSYNVDLVCCSSLAPECNFYDPAQDCPLGLIFEDANCSSSRYCIRSKGTYKGTQRAIETTYGSQTPMMFENYGVNDDMSPGVCDVVRQGQTFTVGTVDPSLNIVHRPIFIRLMVNRVNAAVGNFNVSIQGVDGAGHPDDTSVLCVGSIPTSSIGVAGADWYRIGVSGSNCQLNPSTTYAIVVEAPNMDCNAAPPYFIYWRVDSDDGYTGGNKETKIGGGLWSSDLNRDFMFEVWGYPI